MRRFGAGSLGPKPLILPLTSHCESLPPQSAPVLERSETTPAFFPTATRSSEDSGSPLLGRRRASTIANELEAARKATITFSHVEQQVTEESMINFSPPSSAKSEVATPRFSSLGSACGRNLMEELTAVRSKESSNITVPSADVQREVHELQSETQIELSSSDPVEADHFVAHEAVYTKLSQSSISNSSSPSSVTAVPGHRRHRSRSTSGSLGHSPSTFDRLRIFFGDLWRSPVALARHLVQTAQARIRIPRSLINVQWWLVGVLLGPMVKRRLLSRSGCCEDLEEQPLLLDSGQSKDVESGGLAYGTLYATPPNSVSRNPSRLGGNGDRNISGKMRCPHHRRKHSPWLWVKFSITLAFAIGAAFKDGPGSLLRSTVCYCQQKGAGSRRRIEEQMVGTS